MQDNENLNEFIEKEKQNLLEINDKIQNQN